MGEITFTYDPDTKLWSASAPTEVTLNDAVVLFRNLSVDRACLVTFDNPKAFGIDGISLLPHSTFPLIFRGHKTDFKFGTTPTKRQNGDPGTGTIPPGC